MAVNIRTDENTQSQAAYHPTVWRTLTAFTHPRRLAILCLLQERNSLYAEDIAAITRISLCAFSRHARKLRLRGLVQYDGGKWSLVRPRDPLARTLLSLIAAPS